MSAVAAPLRNRDWYESYVSTFPKGRVLSHLLGMVIASQFVVSGAAHEHIPYAKLPLNTAWLDVPLRVILLWLILDRNWRIGKLKFTAWDAIALGFPVIVGLAYPFSVSDPTIGASADGFKAFFGDMLRFYTVFILVREGHLRAGFNGRTVLNWVMLGLSASAGLALLQAANVGGVRKWSEEFFDQHRTFNQNETYRARGTAQHWNGFASEMVVGLLIAASALQFRKLKWWEYGFGTLFVLGLLVSTSRGGYATLFITIAAAGVFFLFTKRPKTGGIILGTLAISVLAFSAIVVSAKVELFKDLLVPPKVESADIGSLKYRMEQGRKLMKVGMQHPIFGTGPSERLYFNEHTTFFSSSSVPGKLDVTYPLLFAQFGIVGILYMLALTGFFLRFALRRYILHPYALLAFCTGVALAVHSFSEMLLLSELMYLVAIVAALAVTRFKPIELARKPVPRQIRIPRAKLAESASLM
ncbi:MAG: O-antigen ligase family protein [Fimbriimonas sp.]